MPLKSSDKTVTLRDHFGGTQTTFQWLFLYSLNVVWKSFHFYGWYEVLPIAIIIVIIILLILWLGVDFSAANGVCYAITRRHNGNNSEWILGLFSFWFPYERPAERVEEKGSERKRLIKYFDME